MLSPELWRVGHRQNQHPGVSCALTRTRGVQMKRVFLGSVALIALGLGTPAAFAADMRVAPAPVAPPAYSWSGCYIGGGGGYSNGQSTHYTRAGTRVTPALGAAPGAIGPPAGVNITDQFNLSGFIRT